jgi:hypothetical protein
VSPGPASGSSFLIDVLVPNNVSAPASFALTGTLSGTASAVSGTWTSGQLDSFLGISASPVNPIGAFLPSTQVFQPSAIGFHVFQATFGTTTLQGPSNPNISPLENINPGLPLGSYIVGFLNEGTAAAPDWVATANSGAIFATPAPIIGHGLFVLFAVGSVLFGGKLLEGFKKRHAAA